MGEKTGIEWSDSTFNPWIGCTRLGPGCDHCYAEQRMDKRLHVVNWGTGQPRKRTSAANWRGPLQWEREHEAFAAANGGRRRRVFCASLADVFDNEVDPAWRQDLFDLIANTPHLDWLLLTKRIGNAADMINAALLDDGPQWPWPNVWLGATVVDQTEADRDIPKLLAAPAAKRFLSIEPMLGPVDLTEHLWGRAKPCGLCPRDLDCECGLLPRNSVMQLGEPALSWVIVGGESGPHARPMHPDWARSVREQCAAAGVPFLFKQRGEWLPWHHFLVSGIEDGDGAQPTKYATVEWRERQAHDVGRPDYWDSMDGAIDGQQCMGRVGKKAAGRLLDGREHNGFPA